MNDKIFDMSTATRDELAAFVAAQSSIKKYDGYWAADEMKEGYEYHGAQFHKLTWWERINAWVRRCKR